MKFEREDREFFERRAEFEISGNTDNPWAIVDHWPLFVGTVNLARNLAILDLLKSTLGVPGHVAEFGCWRGSTSLLLAKGLRIFDPLGPKLVHLFDSFEGLSEFVPQDGRAIQQSGDYRGVREVIEQCAALAGVDEEIVIHEGLIEDTLPEFVSHHPETRFSFVYCDTDLYSATKTIIQLTWQLVTPGGLMVFDQWNMDEFPGEGVAVNEFLQDSAESVELIKPANTRQPSLALRKIK